MTTTASPKPSDTAPENDGGAQNTQTTRRTVRPSRSPAATVALYLLLGLSILIFALPVYWLFTSAFKPEQEIYQFPLQWVPTAFEWENFSRAWNAVPFDRFYANSIITAVVGTSAEVMVAILCAYAFAWVEFRWKTPVFLFLVGSMMLPGHITLLVNYITIGNLGWINTYQGIILPGLGSAFAMFLLFQKMRQVPRELVDAAQVDGAGHMRRLFSVVLPVCRPMLITATLIVFIGKWNAFVWPLIITTTAEMRTLPIGLLYLRNEEGYINWGSIMAGTLLVALPTLIIFFIAQRKIIGGLAGGLKG